MSPPAATQKLNAKLGASDGRGASDSIGLSWRASAIHSSAPPVRIIGAGSRYQGGYRVNV